MTQKQKNKPYIPTEESIMTDCISYNLPRAVVEEIYSLKRDWNIGFIIIMSIVEYDTSLLKLILDFNSEKRWEAYMKAIDDEI